MDGSILCGWIRETLRITLDSQLFYSFSTDGGVTWAPNVAVSDSFNPLEGWPHAEQDRRLYHYRVG